MKDLIDKLRAPEKTCFSRCDGEWGGHVDAALLALAAAIESGALGATPNESPACVAKERDEWLARCDRATQERDEARAEAERLKADVERLTKAVDHMRPVIEAARSETAAERIYMAYIPNNYDALDAARTFRANAVVDYDRATEPTQAEPPRTPTPDELGFLLIGECPDCDEPTVTETGDGWECSCGARFGKPTPAPNTTPEAPNVAGAVPNIAWRGVEVEADVLLAIRALPDPKATIVALLMRAIVEGRRQMRKKATGVAAKLDVRRTGNIRQRIIDAIRALPIEGKP